MKTITITAKEEKIILLALAARTNRATRDAEQIGLPASYKEKFLNVAIDAKVLHNKISDSK